MPRGGRRPGSGRPTVRQTGEIASSLRRKPRSPPSLRRLAQHRSSTCCPSCAIRPPHPRAGMPRLPARRQTAPPAFDDGFGRHVREFLLRPAPNQQSSAFRVARKLLTGQIVLRPMAPCPRRRRPHSRPSRPTDPRPTCVDGICSAAVEPGSRWSSPSDGGKVEVLDVWRRRSGGDDGA